MRWPPRRTRPPRAPRTPRRLLVTPEGVALDVELGSRGARLGAFLLDAIVLLAVLIGFTFLAGWLAIGKGRSTQVMSIIWLVGAFALRNGWFMLWEIGPRAATPAKRLLKLRVIARDGGRLTVGAIVVRNAMREVELFLPAGFLFQEIGSDGDGVTAIAGLFWSLILTLFPLLNRDRLRVGDLLAGTWVVRSAPAKLERDLAHLDAERSRRSFPPAVLDLYGVFELQTLEDVLRHQRDDAIATVAGTIRRKAGLADDGDDRGFLEDYYLALCGRLERDALFGRRRADKHDGTAARAR